MKLTKKSYLFVILSYLFLSSHLFGHDYECYQDNPEKYERLGKGIVDFEGVDEAPSPQRLVLNDQVRAEITKVISINGEEGRVCPDEYIQVESVEMDNGEIFHLAYTNDDYCDGGNAYGVVLNASLEQVYSIQDYDIYCPILE